MSLAILPSPHGRLSAFGVCAGFAGLPLAETWAHRPGCPPHPPSTTEGSCGPWQHRHPPTPTPRLQLERSWGFWLQRPSWALPAQPGLSCFAPSSPTLTHQLRTCPVLSALSATCCFWWVFSLPVLLQNRWQGAVEEGPCMMPRSKTLVLWEFLRLVVASNKDGNPVGWKGSALPFSLLPSLPTPSCFFSFFPLSLLSPFFSSFLSFILSFSLFFFLSLFSPPPPSASVRKGRCVSWWWWWSDGWEILSREKIDTCISQDL